MGLVVMGSASAGPVRAGDLAFVVPALAVPLPELREVKIERPPAKAEPSCSWDLQLPFVCGGNIEWILGDAPALGLIELFGSVEDFALALEADTVELVELWPMSDPAARGVERTARRSAVTITPEDAAALRGALTADESYHWDHGTDWVAEHNLRIKFKKGARSVALDISLAERSARTAQGDAARMTGNFKFGYAAIAQVLKRYIPDMVSDEQ